MLCLTMALVGYVTCYITSRQSLALVTRDPSVTCWFPDTERIPRPDRNVVWSSDEWLSQTQLLRARPAFERLRGEIAAVVFWPLVRMERLAFGHRITFALR